MFLLQESISFKVRRFICVSVILVYILEPKQSWCTMDCTDRSSPLFFNGLLSNYGGSGGTYI